MNEQEVATLSWHNGNITPNEAVFSKFDFNYLFSNNLVEYYFTFGTKILFFDETLSRIKSSLKIHNINSHLFADETGEKFRAETNRLLIRNKYYKTARCYILFSLYPETNSLNEYIFLVPDPLLFDIDKIIKKTIVSNQFLKPSGAIMNFPTMEYEFRKIIRMEIEYEKADDCIILNHDQYIIESYLGNIFLLEPGFVLTPSLSSGCIPFIMRKIIINFLGQLHFQVVEKNDLQVEKLFEANEVIIAGETGIYSLKGIEYKRYFDNTRKVLIAKIVEAYKD